MTNKPIIRNKKYVTHTDFYRKKLRNFLILKSISEEELDDLYDNLNIEIFKENSYVINQGEAPSHVYFILDGRVRAIYSLPNGKNVHVRDFGPGNLFGEIGAFDDHRTDGSFVTMEKSVIGSISKYQFREFSARSPVVAEQVMRHLANRTRQFIHRLLRINTLGAVNRIHSILLQEGRRGMLSNNKAEIRMPPTHAEIAFRADTQREVVTRELNRLARQGVLSKSRKHIVIEDIRQLERLVVTANH